jgi:hypothetical protein
MGVWQGVAIPMDSLKYYSDSSTPCSRATPETALLPYTYDPQKLTFRDPGADDLILDVRMFLWVVAMIRQTLNGL